MKKRRLIQWKIIPIILLLLGEFVPNLAYSSKHSVNPPAATYDPGAIDSTGQVLCEEETGVLIRAIQSLSNASGSNDIHYKWQVSVNGGPFRDISGNHDSPTFIPTRFNTFGSYFIFKRLVQFERNGIWYESRNTYKLVIDRKNRSVSLTDIQASAEDICKEEPVTLTVQGTTNSLNRIHYTWSNGASGATITVRPSTTTIYTVTASVSTGSCMATATQSITIHVYPEFNAGIIASAHDTVCLNSPAPTIEDVRSATGGHGTKSYRWKVNGVLIPGATAATYTPTIELINTPGTYTFSREATDEVCSDWTPSENEYTLVVSNLSVSPVEITAQDALICNRQSALLTASIESQTPTQWQWFAGAGSSMREIEGATSSSFQTPFLTESTTFTVTATTMLSSGNLHCSATGIRAIQVTVLKPDISIGGISAPAHFCYGDRLTLSTSIEEAIGHQFLQWYVGEDMEPVPGSNSTSYETEAMTADQRFTVVATSSLTEGGITCLSSDTQTVNLTVPEPLSLTLTAQNESCEGQDGVLSAAVTGGTPYQLGEEEYFLYSWYRKEDSGDSILIRSNITEINQLRAGSYSVIIKDANECSAWAEKVVTLDNPLNIGREILAKPTICNGGSFSVIPQDGPDGQIPAGTLYSWEAPLVAGVTGTVAGLNQSSIHDENLFYNGSESSVDIPYFITATYGNICSNSTTLVVKVNVSVFGSIHISTTNDTVCPNIGTRTLTANLSDINQDYDLIWTFNGSSDTIHYAAGNTRPSFSVEIPAEECDITYPYTIEIQDAQHCQNSQSGDIVVHIPHWQIATGNQTDTVACYLDAVAPEPPVVVDGCGESLQPQLVGFEPRSTTPILCEGIVTYTYRYTACDNSTQDWTYTYVITDSIAPVLEDCSELNETLTAPNCQFLVPDFESAVLEKASDNCAIQEYVQTPSAGTIITQDTTIEVYVKDLCGNESEHQHITLKVQDVATGMQSRTGYVRCNGGSFQVTPRGEHIPDNTLYIWTVDTSLHVTGQSDQHVPIAAPFSQSLYNSDSVSQTVLYRVTPISNGCPGQGFVIIVDVEPTPQLSIKCPRDTSITLDSHHCNRALTADEIGTPQWTHSLGWDNVILSNDIPNGNVLQEGDNLITWTLTDECGNSQSCEQHIHIALPVCPDAVDYEGNIYPGVLIDCYCWTQRNLESTRYSDGRPINGIYSYYSDLYPNTSENVRIFGRLYDWESVIRDGTVNVNGHIQGICPEGWYLPTAEQYETLYAHGTTVLKSPLYWIDGGGDNSTGFTSLPGGYYDGAIGRYLNLMGEAYYWSTRNVNGAWESAAYSTQHNCLELIEIETRSGLGYSVRCIKEIE